MQFSVYNLNATVCVSLAAKFFLVTPKAKMSCLSWSTLRLCLKINKSVCLRFGFDPRGVLSVFDKHKKLKIKKIVEREFDCPEVVEEC